MFRIAQDNKELKSFAGFSISAPSGFAGSYGGGAIGLGGSLAGSTLDGGFSIGGGFGDANNGLGGSVGVSVPSVSFDGGFFEKGSLNLSVGHNFMDQLAGVSVGMTGLDIWRSSAATQLDPSFYISASKALNVFFPTILTAGIGSHTFAKATNGIYSKDKFGAFFGLGFYFHPQVAVAIDYASEVTTFALNLAPAPDYPVTLALGVNGFFKENKNEELTFVSSVGWGFNY